MKLVNLTPHDVVIEGEPGPAIAVTIPADGRIAHLQEKVGIAFGGPVVSGGHVIQLRTVSYGDASLPAPEPGVMYIVPRLTAMAYPRRMDLCFPGGEIRDSAGRVTDRCRYLAIVSMTSHQAA